jgi:hypothetical protein
MATYAQAQRGLAGNTANTLRYAKVYFNVYGASKDFDTFDELLENDRSDILCDVATWREFATWLHSYGRQISNQSKHIGVDAALSYLSQLTQAVCRKFPEHHTWNNLSFNTWYQDIRKEIQKVIGRREIEEGDDDGEELQDIDLKTLIRLVAYWNSIGNQDSMIKACSGSLSFFGMGRSGEFSYLTGDTLKTHALSLTHSTYFITNFPHSH